MGKLAPLLLLLVACGHGAGLANVGATNERPPSPNAAGDQGDTGLAPCNTTEACATACARHAAMACRRLGAFTLERDVAALSMDRLASVLRDACGAQVMAACGYQGLLEERAITTHSVDVATAAAYRREVPALYRAACDGGEASACDRLVERAADAETISTLRARADALRDAACTAGDGDACDELARSLDVRSIEAPVEDPATAPRVAALYARAAALMPVACEGGDALACQTLAEDYTNMGYAVETDLAASEATRARACALAPELCPTSVALDRAAGPTTIRPGDSLATVQRTYGLTAAPEGMGWETDMTQYHLASRGLWFFFEGDVVASIRVDVGAVDGVAVGDTEATLRRVRGEPASRFDDGASWMYPSPTFGHARYSVVDGNVSEILVFP